MPDMWIIKGINLNYEYTNCKETGKTCTMPQATSLCNAYNFHVVSLSSFVFTSPLPPLCTHAPTTTASRFDLNGGWFRVSDPVSNLINYHRAKELCIPPDTLSQKGLVHHHPWPHLLPLTHLTHTPINTPMVGLAVCLSRVAMWAEFCWWNVQKWYMGNISRAQLLLGLWLMVRSRSPIW